MSTLRRYVRAEWSCPKCGASNPRIAELNAANEATRGSLRIPPPPPPHPFDPQLRYRQLDTLDTLDREDGWLEAECPRCGHLQKFATEDAKETA